MNTLSPLGRRLLFLAAMILYAGLVLYAARADVPFSTSFFILQCLGAVTFIVATAALIIKK